ncbi:MAG: FAD-dependent oxidoreductase, partial [Chloroflexi bacterium]|nr:FAD-dependent oxidoreductase [Chloroflexota bacterium]
MFIHRTRWRVEADVVIVGYGAAGAAAAVAAREAGCEVIVIEKQEAPTPLSNSFMSGGGFICSSDAKEARSYLEALYRTDQGIYWTDPDILQTWVDRTLENKDWLEKRGAEFQLYRHCGGHDLPGTESMVVYQFTGMGPGMMRFLYEQVDKAHIPVMRGMRATRVLEDSRNNVVGIEAREAATGKALSIKARRAVILTTGGYEFDEEAKLQYLKVYPCYFHSSPWNTGDGIKMSLEVGAQLWHMNSCAAGCVMKFPELATGRLPYFGGPHWVNPGQSGLPPAGGEGWLAQHVDRSIPIAGYLITDRYGRRYA